jgi:hypothetical protein
MKTTLAELQQLAYLALRQHGVIDPAAVPRLLSGSTDGATA